MFVINRGTWDTEWQPGFYPISARDGLLFSRDYAALDVNYKCHSSTNVCSMSRFQNNCYLRLKSDINTSFLFSSSFIILKLWYFFIILCICLLQNTKPSKINNQENYQHTTPFSVIVISVKSHIYRILTKFGKIIFIKNCLVILKY